ncbi:MAG TPA: helical backbone metal receptor, partial [Thermoanaerobaculia bacterium]|nr:helical backbone metal receptor [Thermoanaerobaculia bacterium]
MIEAADALGRVHRFSKPPARVVSLVPSLTETLFDIGAGASVAGVTDFCLFPESAVAALPRLGGTKNPRACAIRALDPNLVYVNIEENLARDAEEVAKFAPVFATEPKTVAGVVDLLGDLGRIHGREQAAAEWQERIAREIELARASRRSFSFACPIWKNPWMWCGGDTYVSDLVATAGGTNVLASAARYPKASLEDVLALAPEVIFLPDEPYLFSDSDVADLRRDFKGRVIGPFP